MIIRHTPLGKPELAQDSLPENWKEVYSNSGDLPSNFGVVIDEKLYRSGVILPSHIENLRNRYGIKNIVSLVDRICLDEFEDREDIIIHHIPVLQRRELTFDRIKELVNLIDSTDEPFIVSCLKGKTRTGMVIAGYQVLHGMNRFGAMIGSIGYGNGNISSFREMLAYSKGVNE